MKNSRATRIIATEGLADSIKSIFKSNHADKPKNEDKSKQEDEGLDGEFDSSVINLLMKQRDELVELKKKVLDGGEKTLTFKAYPLTHFKSAKEIESFLAWCKSLVEFIPVYYKAFLQAHEAMLPAIEKYSNSLDREEEFVKNYIAIIKKIPNKDKLKSLGFKRREKDDDEFGEDYDVLRMFVDDFGLYSLVYKERTKDEGYEYDLSVPHISYIEEWGHVPKQTEIILSASELDKLLGDFISLLGTADNAFEDSFENYVSPLFYLANKIDHIVKVTENKYGVNESKRFTLMMADISRHIERGYSTNFFYETFGILAKTTNQLLKAIR